MRDRSQSPKASFINTRSRFYNKKPSQNYDQQPLKESPQKNTGVYWKQKGNQAFRKGQVDQAILFYTKAIEVGSSESVYYSNRAKCYKLKRNLKQALKDAEEACQVEDTNIKAHYLCGCILAELAKQDATKIRKAQNRLKKGSISKNILALRLCSSLKKKQFIEQISIKLYRLKKLSWFVQKQQEYSILNKQMKVIQKSYEKKIITKQEFQDMQRNNKKILARYSTKQQIPDHLCCKITLQLMEQPFCTQAGLSYQKIALQDHLKTNGMIQPITRQPITGKIYPNVALKNAIEEFLVDNPWAFEHTQEEDYTKIQF